MEKVSCSDHGGVCMLKTGVKDGPNKGKSFYMCVVGQGCDFNQLSSVPASYCLQHEKSMVELQALTYSQQQKSYRLFYRCVDGKKSGQRWCGSVPWSTPAKEKMKHVTDAPLQPVRNPFKAGLLPVSKTNKSHYQSGDVEEKEKNDKENLENKNVETQDATDSYRGKPLPPGMKVKKRVSDDQSQKAKDGEMKENCQQQAEMVNSDSSEVKYLSPTSSSDTAHSKKVDLISMDANKSPSPSTDSCVSVSSRDMSVRQTFTDTISTKPDDADDVILISVAPATQNTTPGTGVQKTITSFPGFQKTSKSRSQSPQANELLSQLQQKKATLAKVNVEALPDKGERLKTQVKDLEEALESMSLASASPLEISGASATDTSRGISNVNPFSRPGGTILLSAPPAMVLQDQASGSSMGLHQTQGYSQEFSANAQVHAFYGGRMTEDRMLAVKNATCEAIGNLHKSLESSPGPETEVSDPKYIKVTLMPHQRRALAWLQWRETQSPCGGILADDMGLGKTLTMIALILSGKIRSKEEGKRNKETEEEQEQELWLSKQDSRHIDSKGTLIICPASLVHHWKNEIDRHVKAGKLSVYLYHGPNRERSAKLLAEHDVVVTTYSLVSKEVPVQKEDPEKPKTDFVSSSSGPLMQVSWARVVLDEAHNIKNPKVQTSMAVCQLKSDARWAVTGTPIQNNLLDVFSLLKFLKCSPFDEYKLWKAQVDNGSKRGRERLDILTRTLLLRRTKEDNDSCGKPLVCLPERTCTVHQLKLSEDEKAVYDVVFAQSRSTLQNYLKRHEEKDLKKGNASTQNPFNKVAQEFGFHQADLSLPSSQQPQQASSTVHILSLLLRLRQSCCHLSLLKKTLDSSELQGDGIVLSLEEQLNALSLSSTPSPSDSRQDSVSLNGSRFPAKVFETKCQSTKISAIMSELKEIQSRGKSEKSVIVSQWTSMLRIVAAHLIDMNLKYAVIDGTVNPKKRMDLVEEFNTNLKGPQVMLVSLCAGGVGLNLVGGNHLFLIDMHWNPALEDQACDRIYRVGQTRDVTIHRFVCEDTVEEKISTLQQKKKELAKNVLSGTGNTFTKLSLADLRIIFGV